VIPGSRRSSRDRAAPSAPTTTRRRAPRAAPGPRATGRARRGPSRLRAHAVARVRGAARGARTPSGRTRSPRTRARWCPRSRDLRARAIVHSRSSAARGSSQRIASHRRPRRVRIAGQLEVAQDLPPEVAAQRHSASSARQAIAGTSSSRQRDQVDQPRSRRRCPRAAVDRGDGAMLVFFLCSTCRSSSSPSSGSTAATGRSRSPRFAGERGGAFAPAASKSGSGSSRRSRPTLVAQAGRRRRVPARAGPSRAASEAADDPPVERQEALHEARDGGRRSRSARRTERQEQCAAGRSTVWRTTANPDGRAGRRARGRGGRRGDRPEGARVRIQESDESRGDTIRTPPSRTEREAHACPMVSAVVPRST
jgi:hypothetical protein